MSPLGAEMGTESEWQEARSRLKEYFRALRISAQEPQDRVIQEVLAQAALNHGQNRNESPVALAMHELRERSDQWFGQLLETDNRPSIRGLVSFFAIEGEGNWDECFLAEEIPDEFHSALLACEVRASPELKFSSMVPQAFENPLLDITIPTALKELTKDLTPSIVTKVATFIISGLSLWLGKAPR